MPYLNRLSSIVSRVRTSSSTTTSNTNEDKLVQQKPQLQRKSTLRSLSSRILKRSNSTNSTHTGNNNHPSSQSVAASQDSTSKQLLIKSQPKINLSLKNPELQHDQTQESEPSPGPSSEPSSPISFVSDNSFVFGSQYPMNSAYSISYSSFESGIAEEAGSNDEVRLPENWEIRYDTILCQYYYVNLKENLVQFDSPLEVINYKT